MCKSSWDMHSIREALLIWATSDMYQSQLLEASCITLFPSWNKGPGDVTVSRTFASVCMYLSGISGKTAPSSFQDQAHNSTSIPSIHSVPTAPLLNTAQSQGASAGGLYVQGINDDARVNRLSLPIASFPSRRVIVLRRQHLRQGTSGSYITASQPNPG